MISGCSDYDTGSTWLSRACLPFSAAYPDHNIEFSVKSRHSLWESLFAHLRDPKRNPLADVMELPQNWTELFAKLGLLSDLSTGLRRCLAPLSGIHPQELCREELHIPRPVAGDAHRPGA